MLPTTNFSLKNELMKNRILLTLIWVVASLQIFGQTSGFIFIDVDVASHVKLTRAGIVVPLIDGKNKVEYKTWDQLVISPVAGYQIEKPEAFDTDGKPVQSVWWLNSADDSYSTQFTSYNYDGYTYRIVTREYKPELSTVTVTIDNPSAIKNGVYTVGNVSVDATAGVRNVEYDPEKGSTMSLTLAKTVAKAELTLNGNAQEYDENALGEKIFSFSIANGDKVILVTEMEKPEFTLKIDAPDHLLVAFPDADTVLTGLESGANELEYFVGDVLTVKAAEGYRITVAEGLKYSSYTNTYIYTFKGGESGKIFNVETEEYNPPMAELVIELEKPELLSRVVADVVTNKFTAGKNTIKVNLEKDKSVQIVYNIKSEDEAEAKLDGNPLPVDFTWIYSSTIENLEPKSYHIMIGTPGWTPVGLGIEMTQADNDRFEVYSTDGRMVLSGKGNGCLSGLKAGIYIINGKKVQITK